MPSLFITGTDTGVGKTVVTAQLASCLLAKRLSVCVIKPVQTGISEEAPELPSDPAQIQHWLFTRDEELPEKAVFDAFCVYQFGPPAAPAAADPTGSICLDVILQAYKKVCARYDWVLVEGAGGLRVPIVEDKDGSWIDTLDLIKKLSLPTLLVSRPMLGTINHTRLSVDALTSAALPIAGVVVSGYPDTTDDVAMATLPDILRRYLFSAASSLPFLIYTPSVALAPGCFHPFQANAAPGQAVAATPDFWAMLEHVAQGQ
jgi:dethiobiotin synthetase